jgi:YYY domain-containing protein
VSETLTWWFMVQVVGLAALPMCLLLFRCLPDRGYALSKPFALILVGYWFWIGNIASILPNSTRAIFLVVLIVALLSAFLAWRSRGELVAFLRERWWLIAGAEVVFFLSFVTAAYLRSFVPDLGGTEKPMDFMYLNAMIRAEDFPPPDPWLANESVSYYYFGYLIASIMTRVSGVAAGVGFNLALATVVALAATGAFGLVYNLAASRTQRLAESGPGTPAAGFHRAVLWKPMVFGVAGALLLVVLGNLEGLLEAMAANNIGADFLDWAGINELVPYDSTRWYPDQFWFWWRATRIINVAEGTWGIHEFPFFSFLLGDLHPHVMSIPFVLLGLGGMLALLRSDEPLDLVVWLERPFWLVAYAILLGGLAFLNTWDMPTMAVLIAAVTVIRNRLHAGVWSWGLVIDSIGFLAPLYIAAFLAYTPFFFGGFASQAAGFGITTGAGSRPFHMFLIWGIFATMVLPYAFARIRASGRPLTASALWSLTPFLAVVLAWLFWDSLEPLLRHLPDTVRWNTGAGSVSDQISERGSGWITAIFLGGALALLCLALYREIDSASEGDSRTGPIVALLLSTIAALLILGAEFVFIRDNFNSRMNTIFKLYYQSWLFLSIAGGFILYDVFGNIRMRSPMKEREVTSAGTSPPSSLATVSPGDLLIAGAALVGAIAGAVVMAGSFFTVLVGAIVIGGLFFFLAGLVILGTGSLAPDLRKATGGGRIGWRGVWGAAIVVVLSAGLVYPVTATWNRTDGCAGYPLRLLDNANCSDVFSRRQVDGLKVLQASNPSEYNAIKWLLAREGQPGIAEGLGDSYSEFGRVSASTGLPTPLQWPGHEAQWRGDADLQAGRPEDLEVLYTSTDPNLVRAVVERYGISYVYVGERERQKYPNMALPTMPEVVRTEPVFQDGEVAIYQILPNVGEVTSE